MKGPYEFFCWHGYTYRAQGTLPFVCWVVFCSTTRFYERGSVTLKVCRSRARITLASICGWHRGLMQFTMATLSPIP